MNNDCGQMDREMMDRHKILQVDRFELRMNKNQFILMIIKIKKNRSYGYLLSDSDSKEIVSFHINYK